MPPRANPKREAPRRVTATRIANPTVGKRTCGTMDANEAVARVAYPLNEVIVLYPITPSSPMGEWADDWAAVQRPNLWGTVPSIIEMQSEGGVAGALHGALQTGALATTFTASQGLLLMLPVMHKIAGELTPTVLHVTARAVATHALSIFGDHSDVMSARNTGFAMLCSSSVQEAMDFALLAQAATLESRIPFLHFFDGFRTSHEILKIEVLSTDVLRSMVDPECILAHRARALSPDHPVLRGTAQNPDVYFQAREAANPWYLACPAVVEKAMNRFAGLTGRQYRLFDYHGAADAERVIILMGSGCEAAHETVDFLVERGEKVGVVKVRLYRPFDVRRFIEALPSSVQAIAVLDRTKEPGGVGEPLYLDCVAALAEGAAQGWSAFKTPPRISAGRYGLASKEFTPAMIKSIFDQLKTGKARVNFTVGIQDDVTHTSLACDPEFSVEPDPVFRALFYGLGSDGTVSANKNSIKIIGEKTAKHVQGYFVYDSKKSGAITVSHLRVSPEPIRSSYLITRANFIACHHPSFLHRYDVLGAIVPGGVFLLNTACGPDEIWERLPDSILGPILAKNIKCHLIDAEKIARECGLQGRINTVMQVCFFALTGILPKDDAIAEIKHSIEKTYGKKGEEVVRMNLRAVDRALEGLIEAKAPDSLRTRKNGVHPQSLQSAVSPSAPPFVREVLGEIIAGRGDDLPVSAFSPDGTFPTGTARWEKRNLASELPVWDPLACVQCCKCVLVCPTSALRANAYDEKHLVGTPPGFQSCDARAPSWKGRKFTIQVAPEDCTGCRVCVEVCPAHSKTVADRKALHMLPQKPLLAQEKKNWEFFLNLPPLERELVDRTMIRQQQVQEPLFEFSGACAGCGETPYLKLVSQLFGDRAVIANATGCSSIYGGNLPTTPWSKNKDGRGPAWSNSLFEDNAEFGLGFRLSIDKQKEFASELLKKHAAILGEDLARSILSARQESEADIHEQRTRVASLKDRLKTARPSVAQSVDFQTLLSLADMLVKKSVWIVGGDGWAYDIGFGGLDHVMASGRDVNILVLDTEVYSNTGGQMSKATPRAAVARFAAAGRQSRKKDLGLMAMTYGNVYVAQVAMGSKDDHTLKTFLEAEAYPGPSLIIAYCHCAAHGIDLKDGLRSQKGAVDSGHWLLYRYHPERAARGLAPLQVDSPPSSQPIEKFFGMENRFRILAKSAPKEAADLFAEAQRDVDARRRLYQNLAALGGGTTAGSGEPHAR